MRKDRDFIFLYLSDWLENGIKRTLSEAERGCFAQLLCQAGRSPDPGTLHLLPGKPYEDEKLAQLLHVRTRTLRSTIKLLSEMGMIVRDDDGIHITNWKEDQPPWDPRGGKRKTPGKVTKTSPSDTKQPAITIIEKAGETTALKHLSEAETVNRTEKKAWMERKDLEADALEWFAATGEAFTALQAKHPLNYQQKLGDYKRQHPEKFRK